MKLKISYPTKEKHDISENSFRYVIKKAELTPVRIIRRPCGTGKAANRYYYEAEFIAPDDARFVNSGLIIENIIRKLNPDFNPKKFDWKDNFCNISLYYIKKWRTK